MIIVIGRDARQLRSIVRLLRTIIDIESAYCTVVKF